MFFKQWYQRRVRESHMSESEEGTLTGEEKESEEGLEEINENFPEEPPTKKHKAEVVNEEELKRRGIVFISRMPPGMRPHHLRTLLTPWGIITRIYCAPETLERAKARKKSGGNGRVRFSEAWVEFSSKRKAYEAALSLNGQRIGERKKDPWYDDLWCMKFLKHFKWYHLTEERKLNAR
eukprot:TRINITY_DN7005_c0_g2_i1.p1 TRINITY_DN7005_c0_g2~~TRINITY_DN7005_c0_g2_i1.p1  ORF type:complete len:179 (-),score=34.15 TRINITY_DN7005_c0_g2_i1:121-657(-)